MSRLLHSGLRIWAERFSSGYGSECKVGLGEYEGRNNYY